MLSKGILINLDEHFTTNGNAKKQRKQTDGRH
jgi:hypothetical protein